VPTPTGVSSSRDVPPRAAVADIDACYTAFIASRLLQITLLALAAIALLAGCGGDGESGGDQTEGLTPDELLEQAANAFSEQSAYRLAFETEVDAGAGPSALPPSSPFGLLAGLGMVSGEGPVQPPDASLDVAADFGPFSAQANLTWVDSRLFLSIVGRDFEIETGEAVGDLDIAAGARTLLGWIENPMETERVKIDGVSTVRLNANIDRDAVIDDLGPLLTDDGVSDETRSQLKDAVTRGDIDIWIGESDLLPRQIEVGLTLDGEVDELPLATLGLDAKLNFSDFGTSTTISAPDNPQALPLDDLGSILDG